MKTTMKKSMKSMKKSMKKSKAKKAMKKVKKVSKIAKGKFAKSAVLKGSKVKTSGGLKKEDLRKNADGRVVSKKRSDMMKKNYQKSALKKWFRSVSAARKTLKIEGFVPIGGKTAKGQALLKKVRSLYKK